MKDPQAPGKPAPPGDTGQHLYATTRKPLPNNTTRHHTEPTPITTQNPGYPHMVERMRTEAHIGKHPTALESPDGFGPRTEPDR